MIRWWLIPIVLTNKLVLISLDGFRWDYLDRNLPLENLRNLASGGIRAKWMVNQFQTKTFPNHWTLVTGLYEESHGLVDKYFFDEKLNKVSPFKLSISQFTTRIPMEHRVDL